MLYLKKNNAMKRSFILTALSSLLFLTFASCSESFFEYNGKIWATNFHIVYKSPKNLDDSILHVMKSIDLSLSAFNPESTVSLINSNATSAADTLFREVFRLSEKVYTASGGRFDPTLRPLVDLWGFGKADTGGNTPSQEQIDSAMRSVGFGSCALAPDNTVTKKTPETRFDFSAVAKGYGVDCVARLLERNGCADYMIEIGGEIALCGRNPDGKKWRIQIDAPVSAEDNGKMHDRLIVSEFGPGHTAIATSGNYRNYRTDKTGHRFGHTIDSRTGRPSANTTLSATVISADCATADALATACMAMESGEALRMLESYGNGTEGMLVLPDSTGTGFSILCTKGFPIKK